MVEKNPVSAAGVVLCEAAGDDEVRRFIADVIACVGGTEHPSGAIGLDSAEMDEFLAQAQAYLDWQAQGAIPPRRRTSPIMPLAQRTRQAYELYLHLHDKVDQYFAQCQAAAFDERAAERMASSETELQAVDLSNPQAIREFMASAPLARARLDQVLAFDEPVNPFYFADLMRLRKEVIEPALGRQTPALTEQAWRKVKGFFAAHAKWQAAKAGQVVEALGAEKLRRYLDPGLLPLRERGL